MYTWISGIIKMDDVEIGCEAVNWIHLAQGRIQWQVIANMVMNAWVYDACSS
jgi:hypothetical protein